MSLIYVFFLVTILMPDMQDKNRTGGKDTSGAEQELQEQKPLFTFGLIADVQYADISSAGNRFYNSSLEKLESAVSEFRDNSVNFIVNLGDLIEKDYESYKPVLAVLNSSGVKTYHITGNHDYSVDPGYLTRLPVIIEAREGYYSIIYKKYRLIFLNGNEISTYADADKMNRRQASDYIEKLRKKGAINAIDWNGGIGRKQIEWITAQLDQAADNSEKVILLCHFPLAPDNIHNLLNYKEIRDIMSKYNNIIAWFSGHNHEGSYTIDNKVHFVTFKGMVETKKSNSFAIIETYSDRILVRGYGRQNSLQLTF